MLKTLTVCYNYFGYTMWASDLYIVSESCTSNASPSPTDCRINFTTTGRSSTSAEGSICITDTRTCDCSKVTVIFLIISFAHETKYLPHSLKPIFFLLQNHLSIKLGIKILTAVSKMSLYM